MLKTGLAVVTESPGNALELLPTKPGRTLGSLLSLGADLFRARSSHGFTSWVSPWSIQHLPLRVLPTASPPRRGPGESRGSCTPTLQSDVTLSQPVKQRLLDDRNTAGSILEPRQPDNPICSHSSSPASPKLKPPPAPPLCLCLFPGPGGPLISLFSHTFSIPLQEGRARAISCQETECRPKTEAPTQYSEETLETFPLCHSRVLNPVGLFALQGELLSPCRCDGSVRCTHQPCLIRWISERGSWSCELCYFKYQVLAISTKNPLQWQAISLTVIEKVQIAAIILGSLFLIASISWLIWSSLSPSAKWQRQDLLFQICYGMYGFMDIVCIGLIIHEGSSVYRIFKRWQAVNQQWKVLNYDKAKDLGEPVGSGAAKAGGRNSRTNPSSGSERNPRRGQRVRTILNHHCGYTILHILSHLRPNEPRRGASSGREVVMRVTTV
uniref:RING-type E3 ubiquitin transferase n=1 Tax=Gopherus agassizii TaxID=38772 RepID=A0A452IM05_9SAUR